MNQQPIHQQPVYYDEGDGGNNNKWSYYVIALLLAAMAGGGYYFYDKNKQQEEYFQQKLITDSIARDSIGKVEQARQDSIELARNTEEKKQKAEKKIALDSYLNCPDGNHPHKIDLGLPSGTKWACCNVGASKPEAYGDYYAWGETEGKKVYEWRTYKHCDGSQETCHNLGVNIAGTQYDVAYVKWGGSWRMPTENQINELIDNCTYKWTTLNGIKGGKFTSKKNGKSIFLPAADCRFEYSDDWAHEGFYWSPRRIRHFRPIMKPVSSVLWEEKSPPPGSNLVWAVTMVLLFARSPYCNQCRTGKN